ncbi:MAG: lipopolysaccharide kinase InaA family protein, partial [Planctomycetota bacterium]|nr:lipopolysaccharide kinase InaA family protein [Planctomycetota bacterium]
MRPPLGFIITKTNGWTLLIKESLAAHAERLISAEGNPLGVNIARSECRVVVLEKEGKFFRKILHHGGALAPILRGVYLSKKRLFRLLESAEMLSKADIPTPPVVAIGWRPIIPFAWRLVVLTEWQEKAQPLSLALRKMDHQQRRKAILDSASLVRSTFKAGVELKDLHPDNILIDEDGKLCLTDIEDVRLHASAVPLERQKKVILRLMRALL